MNPYLAPCLAALTAASSMALAVPLSDAEASQQLKRMAQAARQLAYSGVYSQQLGNQLASFRLTRQADNSSVHEKRESLDGASWEVISTGNDSTAYAPDPRTLLIAKLSAKKAFPRLLPENPADLLPFYTVRTLEDDRAAGFRCTWLALEPRDTLRYTYQFCLEAKTGLLLKATVLTPQKVVVEQFAFTQLQLGASKDKLPFRASFPMSLSLNPPSTSPVEDRPATDRPDPRDLPTGFKLLRDTKRKLPGHPLLVRHLVYGDGLATFSIFVEPAAPEAKPHLSTKYSQGMMHTAIHQQGDRMVTVLGDLPEATLQHIANTLRIKP